MIKKKKQKKGKRDSEGRRKERKETKRKEKTRKETKLKENKKKEGKMIFYTLKMFFHFLTALINFFCYY